MGIEKIPNPNGDKLRDSVSKKFLGSVGHGKENKTPLPSRVPQNPNVTKSVIESNINTQHEKFSTLSSEPTSIGDKEIALRNEIFRVTVGSELTGLNLPGRGDHDEMGIYIETPQQVLALAPTSEHYISRSVAPGEKSKVGDTDLTIYSLRKYMTLAMAGNPTVVTILFAPKDLTLISSNFSEELLALTPSIISKRSGWKHLGYLDGQRKRMINKEGLSPVEATDEYGYNFKYASHALRLGLQGVELMTTGSLTLPLSEDSRKRCLNIKIGKLTFNEAVSEIDESREELFSLMERGTVKLPDEPDYDLINSWMVSVQLRHWGLS